MGRILGQFHYDPYIAKLSKRIPTQSFLTVTHTQQKKLSINRLDEKFQNIFTMTHT